MDLKFQAFGGKTFRPQPEILLNRELNLFAVVTPWGPRFQTKEVLESLVQNYELYSSDREVTSVYSTLRSLSDGENILRTTILACNDHIFKGQNKESEYTFGYELVCGVLRENQILFVQVGHPYIYLDRPEISLQPLGHVLDLSGGYSRLPKNPPPLPSRLAGLYSDTHFSVFTVPVRPEDRLLFISRAIVPAKLLSVQRESRTLNFMARQLAKDNQDMPFWLGILNLKN